MARPRPGPARGIIRAGKAAPSEAAFAHARYLVDPPVDEHIEHWWSVSWDLPRGRPHVQETLPHPSVHVVVEQGEARVFGVVRGRFTRVLEGRGRVFGAKFLPGAFRPLLRLPVSTLTDRVVPLSDVVGHAVARGYKDAIEGADDDAARVAVATSLFAELLPPPSEDARRLRALFAAVVTDQSLQRVEELAKTSGLHPRDLQRWFRDAVGIPPKWMLQRVRLHEALLRLDEGSGTLADLAADLGYADQAHFAREFKALVGVPPSAYRARR